MSSQDQIQGQKADLNTPDQQQDTIEFTTDEVSDFYNVFIAITENLDPNTSDLAAAIVKKSEENAAVIKQKGNVSETGSQQNQKINAGQQQNPSY
jgi:hypothetical protein